jgi:CheY-like chemotaxis protein
LAGRRVLIVDDNATNRRILNHQIESWNMKAAGASTGMEALPIIRRAVADGDPYELVILDMQMPEMDGLTLASAIAEDPVIADVRMVMLTSLGQRLSDEEMRAVGLSSCLVKPVRQSDLFNVIVNSLADVPQEARPTRPPDELQLEPPSDRRTYRLLLAEDNVVNQEVAVRQLRKLGYSVDVVANGHDVLDRMSKVHIH